MQADLAAKPVQGPSWIKAAKVGHIFRVSDGHMWQVAKVEGLAFGGARVIHWISDDNRKARTECMPTHPDYPRDLTPAERKLEHAALKAARLDFYKRCGFWPDADWRP